MNRDELAQYTQAFVLEPVLNGFSEEIIAINYEGDEIYDGYEIHYHNADGVSFSLQDIGLLKTNFVEENFYNGSYKTASDLVLYFSISSSENTTSALLVTPNSNGYINAGPIIYITLSKSKPPASLVVFCFASIDASTY